MMTPSVSEQTNLRSGGEAEKATKAGCETRQGPEPESLQIFIVSALDPSPRKQTPLPRLPARDAKTMRKEGREV